MSKNIFCQFPDFYTAQRALISLKRIPHRKFRIFPYQEATSPTSTVNVISPPISKQEAFTVRILCSNDQAHTLLWLLARFGASQVRIMETPPNNRNPYSS